jgi:hypothetical protein
VFFHSINKLSGTTSLKSLGNNELALMLVLTIWLKFLQYKYFNYVQFQNAVNDIDFIVGGNIIYYKFSHPLNIDDGNSLMFVHSKFIVLSDLQFLNAPLPKYVNNSDNSIL